MKPEKPGRIAPCNECPFRRVSTPGYIGKNVTAAVYVGQAAGPFWLPCHKEEQYNLQNPMESMNRVDQIAQCAGAAHYRANTGVAVLMPNEIHHLPPDRDKVFATPAELLAHHDQVTIEEAEEQLRKTPVTELLAIELAKCKRGIHYGR